MSETAAKILAVDDDEDFLEYISDFLSSQGYDVHCAADGDAMRDVLETTPINLVLLDLAMPVEDGLSLTKYLRQRSDIGIIILSGGNDTVDRILCIEFGADDFINKTAEPRELLARIKSVLRRVMTAPDPASEGHRLATFDTWQLDGTAMTLRRTSGETVATTPSEFEMLNAFVKHANQVLDREEILGLVKGRDIAAYDRVIDVLVYRLRRIIEENPESPQYIRTIHGKGYMFCADVTFSDS